MFNVNVELLFIQKANKRWVRGACWGWLGRVGSARRPTRPVPAGFRLSALLHFHWWVLTANMMAMRTLAIWFLLEHCSRVLPSISPLSSPTEAESRYNSRAVCILKLTFSSSIHSKAEPGTLVLSHVQYHLGPSSPITMPRREKLS